MKKLLIIFTLLFLTVSCKTKRAVVATTGKVTAEKQVQEVWQHHLASFPAFKTLVGSVQVSYNDGKNSQSLPLSFRMEKDKAIWLSAPLGIAKVFITPEKAAFFNRLDSTYFNGDFSYISRLLGVTVDFDALQNLLLGNALYASYFDKEKVVKLLPEENNRYNLQIIDESPVEVIYRFLPETYRVGSTEVLEPVKQQKAVATYEYQQVGEVLLPHTLKIVATEGANQTEISIEFKGIELNKSINFPFKIPEGFKEITVDK